MLAGILSVVIHNVAIGPIVLGLAQMVSQTNSDNNINGLKKNIEPLSVSAASQLH